MVCHMTTKPETRFWKKLKEVTPRIHWTRIESTSSPGVPDLHGVFKNEMGDSVMFWAELKCTRVKKISITPKQIAWNYSYNLAGGNNFIMAQALGGRGVYIYSGSQARELSITGLDTPPVAIVPYPWNQELLLRCFDPVLHYGDLSPIGADT